MNAPEPQLRVAMDAKYRHWTTTEVAIVRDLYPTEGPQAVAQRLPHRGLAAIYAQAVKLKLKAPRGVRRFAEKRWHTSEAIDAEIRRIYQAGVGRGEVNDLARRLARPRHWIVQRATALGLKTPRFKELPWTPAEEAHLEAIAAHGYTLPVIAQMMRKAGYHRTATACVVKMKRLELSRKGDDTETWSATALGRLMGVDPSTVAKRWIKLEGLPAKRRGTERSEAQGGDEWIITRKAFRGWLKEHAQSVDLRKVDKFFFWSVIFD